MSASWCDAPSQYHYFSDPDNGYINGEVIKISNYKELQAALNTYSIQTGDLLYWDIQGDNHPEHATIISKVDSNFVYYAGNTNAQFDKAITKELYDEKKSTLYIVRLKDEVFRGNWYKKIGHYFSNANRKVRYNACAE